jgi:hypothetical protein
MPSHAYETQFLIALLITLAVETGLLFLVIRVLFRMPDSVVGDGVVLTAGILASLITLPYVWFVLPAYIHTHRTYVLTAESLVLVAETVILMILLRLHPARALVASAICNGASFIVGEIIRAVGR